jgi:beta-N-acetylhexosaminidase
MNIGPLMVDIRGTDLERDEVEMLRDPMVGGVILFSRNYEDPVQLRELVRRIRAIRQSAPLIAVDQEGGRVQRFRAGFTALPPLRWLGRIYDEDRDRARHLAFTCAWVMAAELVDCGVDLSFAPVVDLDRGVSEVIGERAMHREAEYVADLATSYVQGMRAAGMAATAKHYPGHGAVAIDSHQGLPVDTRSRSEIDEDLLPYRRLIGQALAGVMVAHVQYPAVDSEIASLSAHWIGTELRARLGFHGAVFSDDLTMAGAAVGGTVPDRVRRTLAAGADMALVCNSPDAAAASLADLRGYRSRSTAHPLQAMRARPVVGGAPPLRESSSWQLATAQLESALERSGLVLSGTG